MSYSSCFGPVGLLLRFCCVYWSNILLSARGFSVAIVLVVIFDCCVVILCYYGKKKNIINGKTNKKAIVIIHFTQWLDWDLKLLMSISILRVIVIEFCRIFWETIYGKFIQCNVQRLISADFHPSVAVKLCIHSSLNSLSRTDMSGVFVVNNPMTHQQPVV